MNKDSWGYYQPRKIVILPALIHVKVKSDRAVSVQNKGRGNKKVEVREDMGSERHTHTHTQGPREFKYKQPYQSEH